VRPTSIVAGVLIVVVVTVILYAAVSSRGPTTGGPAPGSGGSPTATGGAGPTGSVEPPAPTLATAIPGSPGATATLSPVATLVGAGDIATCAAQNDEATARLVERIPGTVFLAGDNVYDRGTAREYAACYGPSWGAFKNRTKPTPGNHEYLTRGAASYFDYFGAAAGTRGQGWYAYDAGTWRVYALNSNCSAIGGCAERSAQDRWLEADLAAHPARCVLAYWHHPRFSSGMHGNHSFMEDIWKTLYDAGADVVVSGHDHDYERFAPQTHAGRTDPQRGIREFVVGTGGAALRPFERLRPNSEVRNAVTHGVLVLTLREGGYDWRFVAVPGRAFRDSGSGNCH
jgi:hypothetical protein